MIGAVLCCSFGKASRVLGDVAVAESVFLTTCCCWQRVIGDTNKRLIHQEEERPIEGRVSYLGRITN